MFGFSVKLIFAQVSCCLEINKKWTKQNGKYYVYGGTQEVFPTEEINTKSGIDAIIISIKDNPLIFIPPFGSTEEDSKKASEGRNDIAAILNLPDSYNNGNDIKCMIISLSNDSIFTIQDMERIINSITFN